MGLFKKPAKTAAYTPAPSSSKSTAQWRSWERSRGCVICGKKGCDRMNHSHSLCTGCGSAYCNGDGCPGRKRGK